MLNRWLCVILALILCVAPLCTLAEELEVSEDIFVLEENETEAMPVEVEDELLLESVDGAEEALPEPAGDDAGGEPSGAFTAGYWRVVSATAPVYASAGTGKAFARISRDGVLLATCLVKDRLGVTFNSERGIVSGYIPAECMKRLDSDETFEFLNRLAQSEGIVLYEENIDNPLTTPECAFLEEGASDDADPANAGNGEDGDASPTLTLSATKLVIGVTEKCTRLTATLKNAPEGETITWRSSKTKVAKVNKKTGVITGVKAGTAYIYAKTSGGLEKKCKVVVRKAPGKVTLTEKEVVLSVGQTHALKAKLPSNTGSSLTFKSSKKKVASVDAETGVVTALKPGAARITVTTFNKKKTSCKIVVVAEPDQVFLPERLTIAVGEKATVEASAVDRDGASTEADYTFSADEGTGKVSVNSKTGVVKGVAVGTATIRVTTHNGVSTHLSGEDRVETTCEVTVVEPPSEVRLSAKTVTIGVGQTYDLNPQLLTADHTVIDGAGYTASSSNKKRVSVDKNGVVKGLKTGTATVTVKASNGVKATCKVVVLDAPTKVTLVPSEVNLGLGEATRLRVELPSGSAASYVFTSTNESVATVDENGRVTGVGEGNAVITVKTHNGKSAMANVRVAKGADFITLNADYVFEYDESTGSNRVVYTRTMNPGETFQISCTDSNPAYGAIERYECDHIGVATVTSAGLVTAVEPGTANVTVISASGAVATLRVTVVGALPAKLSFMSGNLTLPAGRVVAAPALRGENIDAAALAAATYKSKNSKVFTVKRNEAEDRWELTGVKPGKARLVATAGGAKAIIVVTVTEAAKPAQIRFGENLVYMNVGDTCVPAVLDEYDAPVSASLTSSDSKVVSVDDQGKLTAVAEGRARITAEYEGLSAYMNVEVRQDTGTVTLDVDSLELGVGQRYALQISVNGDGSSSKLFCKSSDRSVATVSDAGVVIARGVGTATITVGEAGGASVTCKVTVYAAPTQLSVSPATISRRISEGGVQLHCDFGTSEMGSVSFSSGDEAVATVSERGYVSLKAVGATTITVVTNNGLSATVGVTVLPEQQTAGGKATYRIFAAYSYYENSLCVKSNPVLPFSKRNTESVTGVFEGSNIGGRGYSSKLMRFPSKEGLLTGIRSYFANTTDDDVSIVYLCSHGHKSGSYSGYRMSFSDSSDPGKTQFYVSSSELFSAVKTIKGSVVLILDSCYSGTFIEDMQSGLDAEDGRIAVLTAASDTKATFYNVKDSSVDFFTYYMLMGLGYDEREGSSCALGADSNGDGLVTLSECFTFVQNAISRNIPEFMHKSWYFGDTTRVQKPRFYPKKLKDLVIYQRR